MPEIELKLAANPADLPAVKRKLLAWAGLQRAPRLALTSVYYDTADRQLKRQGLSLRIRRHNQRYVQTVKTEGSGASLPLIRGEWEDPVAGALPDIRAPNSGAQLPETLRESELHPVFSTVVRRAVIPLKLDGATEIEAALDEGEIRIAENQHCEPICEIELEHKRGDPAAIYEIGLRLLEAAPLRIEIRSKSERGFDLAESGGRELRAVDALPVALEPAMTVEAVLQKFGCECLAVVLRNEPRALAGVAESLHQMRVALRRLRAVLNTFKHMLPDEQYRWVSEDLRWLARALGPARNWDVFIDEIIASVTSHLFGPDDRAALTRAAEEARHRARQEAEASIRSTHYAAALLKLLRWFAARQWRDQPVSEQSAMLMAPIAEVAPSLIARRHKQVCRAAQSFPALDMEQRHQVRIRIKKLRYTVDLLALLFPQDAVAGFIRLLKPLQDELGQANDIRVARDLVTELQNSEDKSTIDRAAGVVLGWHDRGLAEAEPKLLKRIHKLRQARSFW
jgi:inorganic triphosphatase YgiF